MFNVDSEYYRQLFEIWKSDPEADPESVRQAIDLTISMDPDHAGGCTDVSPMYPSDRSPDRYIVVYEALNLS